MGGGASSLPEYLSEEDVKQLYGERFDQNEFDLIEKDMFGYVARAQFLKSVDTRCEAEARVVFNYYCPNGELGSRAFIRLCRDTGLFESGKLAVTDADIIYRRTQAIAKETTSSKLITFTMFRSHVVYQIAQKKEMHEMQILLQISRGQGPTYTNITQPDAVPLYDDIWVQVAPESDGISQESDQSREEPDCSSSSHPPLPNVNDFPSLTPLFLQYAPLGRMACREFLKLLGDASLLDSKFTSRDAELVFAKARVRSANGVGMANGQRVGMDVFCSVALTSIAEKRGMTIPAVVNALLSVGRSAVAKDEPLTGETGLAKAAAGAARPRFVTAMSPRSKVPTKPPIHSKVRGRSLGGSHVCSSSKGECCPANSNALEGEQNNVGGDVVHPVPSLLLDYCVPCDNPRVGGITADVTASAERSDKRHKSAETREVSLSDGKQTNEDSSDTSRRPSLRERLLQASGEELAVLFGAPALPPHKAFRRFSADVVDNSAQREARTVSAGIAGI